MYVSPFFVGLFLVCIFVRNKLPMKNSKSVFIALLTIACLSIHAQPLGPPSPVPVAEGLLILMAAGAGYGCYKSRQRN